MSDLDILAAEAVDNCSVVYLIDEDLCLGNSYEIINTNFDNLSSSQENLSTYSDSWYGLYTIFSANSSKWLNALYNITTLSAQWESAYATKESYKKYWDLPIYLVYPDILEYFSYYANTASYENIFKSWITQKFPPNQYIMNQKIDISINLYIIKSFSYSFDRSHTEYCTPATGDSTANVCCGGCGRGDMALCNFYPGDQTHEHHTQKQCHPICSDGACAITTDTHCESYTCHTYSPPQTLYLNYSASFSDRYVTRIISLVFKNDKTQWVKI